MELLKMIKDLQALLMAPNELPNVVAVRLLARLDEAERHLGFDSAQPPYQPPMEADQPATLEPAENAEPEAEGLEVLK